MKKKVTGPKCSQCGRRRKNMKRYKNLFNNKQETMHDICHTVLVMKYHKQQAAR